MKNRRFEDTSPITHDLGNQSKVKFLPQMRQSRPWWNHLSEHPDQACWRWRSRMSLLRFSVPWWWNGAEPVSRQSRYIYRGGTNSERGARYRERMNEWTNGAQRMVGWGGVGEKRGLVGGGGTSRSQFSNGPEKVVAIHLLTYITLVSSPPRATPTRERAASAQIVPLHTGRTYTSSAWPTKWHPAARPDPLARKLYPPDHCLLFQNYVTRPRRNQRGSADPTIGDSATETNISMKLER